MVAEGVWVDEKLINDVVGDSLIFGIEDVLEIFAV